MNILKEMSEEQLKNKRIARADRLYAKAVKNGLFDGTDMDGSYLYCTNTRCERVMRRIYRITDQYDMCVA